MFGMWWTDVNIKAVSPGEEEEEERGSGMRGNREWPQSSLKVNFLPCSQRLAGPSMLMATTNSQIRLGGQSEWRLVQSILNYSFICYFFGGCLACF